MSRNDGHAGRKRALAEELDNLNPKPAKKQITIKTRTAKVISLPNGKVGEALKKVEDHKSNETPTPAGDISKPMVNSQPVPSLNPFKDTIYEPDHKLFSTSSFKILPWPAVSNFLSFLNPIDLATLSLTCKVFSNVTARNEIWSKFYRGPLGNLNLPSKAGQPIPWGAKYRAIWEMHVTSATSLSTDLRPISNARFRKRSDAWICIMKERKRRVLEVQNAAVLKTSPDRGTQTLALDKRTTQVRSKAAVKFKSIVEQCSIRLAAEGYSPSNLVDYSADRAAIDTRGGTALMNELRRT